MHAAIQHLTEPLERRLLLTVYTVTTAADSGGGSLRQAMLDANNHAGADTIRFAIGSGTKTISPLSALPNISDAVTIDATTQPGYAGKPIIELSGASASGSFVSGLYVQAARCVIKGLVINRFNGTGIIIAAGDGNTVQNCYLGTDATGATAAPMAYNGIEIDTNSNQIGGNSTTQRNVISGNSGIGVFVFSSGAGNFVQGNYIGINAAGSAPVPNHVSGVELLGTGGGNTIGGISPGQGNVISGNQEDGIFIYQTSGSNIVQQNLVGLDATGKIAVGNGGWGCEVKSAYNQIGGTVPGARNVFSHNGQTGIALWRAESQYNTVQGNYVGTDITGTVALANYYAGIAVTGDQGDTVGPSHNLIGGNTAGARNVVSGNSSEGIGLFNAASYNTVSENYIGTTPDGMTALPNSAGGVTMFGGSTGNIIGGTTPGSGNVISGNYGNGGVIIGADGNTIQGNIVGLNAAGSAALSNFNDGIYVTSSFNTIGGPTAGARNIVSANRRGIFIIGPAGSNTIQNNFLGTDRFGTAAIPNHEIGLFTAVGSSGNAILSNTAAFNPVGIRIADGSANRMAGNSVFSNSQVGTDLGYDGVTANDAGDSDTGPNNLQNNPVLTSATASAISGTLNSTPNTTFTLEFFWSPSASPSSGQKSLGTTTLATDIGGNGSFTVTPNGYLPSGFITATATDPAGNTSEYGAAFSYTRSGGTPLVLTGNNVYLKADPDGINLDAWVDSATPGSGNPSQKTAFRSISTITFSGSTGNDTFTLDCSAGNVFGNVTFNGSASGVNTLAIVGTSDDDALTATSASATFTNGLTTFTPISLALSHVQTLSLPGGGVGDDLLAVTSGIYLLNADAPTGTPNVFISVGPAGTGTFTVAQNLAGIAVNGGTLNVVTPSPKLIKATAFSIVNNGMVDLGHNSLLTSAPIANIQAYVNAAYNPSSPNAQDGKWDGRGLTSSVARNAYSADMGMSKYAVGYAYGSDQTTIDEQQGGSNHQLDSVGPNQTLIKPVLAGDANMDGVVDFNDIQVVLGGQYNARQPTRYNQGDMNNDGVLDFNDIQVILAWSYNSLEKFT